MTRNSEMHRTTHLIVITAALAAATPATATIVQNPNFEFSAAGHAPPDTGHATSNDSDISNWTTSLGSLFASDPQSTIFDFTHEFYFLNPSGSGSTDLYQHVTLPTNTGAELAIVASRRKDNFLPDGAVFLELYSGAITTFGGSPITPISVVAPTLSGSLQDYSNTYGPLAAGDYTVRVGGTHGGTGSNFHGAISEVSLIANTVPEPGTIAFTGVGLLGIVLGRRRKQHR